jgi:hypothetical protein
VISNFKKMNMKNTIEHSVRIKESEIGLVAYQMWEQAGHPAGRDLQFWLDAEAQLRSAAKAALAPRVAPLSPVASGHNTVHKAASVQLGPNPPNAAKAQQKFRKF